MKKLFRSIKKLHSNKRKTLIIHDGAKVIINKATFDGVSLKIEKGADVEITNSVFL